MSRALEIFDLQRQVIVITGGAGFLGREFARTLAGAGAHVVVADLNGGAAETLAAEVAKEYGVGALGFPTDVTQRESVEALVGRTKNVFGRIDALVNGAAVDPKFDPAHANEHAQTFEGYPLEAWWQSLNVDLTGAFLCAQAVAPVFKQQNRGVIVNVSSMYGLVGPDQRLYQKDDPRTPKATKPPSYSATKAGLLGLTRYLAAYFAGTNIRVNTLTLGGVFNNHDEQFLKRYNARVPLGRMMNREEVGGPLLFLLSDASSYMTGANLVVDGGWTSW